MSISKIPGRIDVIALDLEATLISDFFSQIPRPGLYNFLEFCHDSCARVVMFTAVSDDRFRQVAHQLISGGYAPAWFADIEYITWDRNIKDLRVESRAGIIPRPSPLDPDVQLSPHPAPDSIRQCLCSCVGNRGNSHVEPPNYCFSSCGDFHLCDASSLAPRM